MTSWECVMTSGNTRVQQATPSINEAAFAYYRRLRRVREFIESHLSEPISLKDAARIAAYEPTYFCAWFHRRAEVRVNEWVTHARLAKAIEIMRTTDCPVWDVARTTGFPSVRTFQRVFKKATQLSPRAFRALVRPS